ncbi:undecaprenyl-diphosphate phosphatase [Glycocaulis sp.]|uniref:undecaprenyl-diphosphate phosphatase n=1 Tax=Glycocaulis sp. TaxID=1969725 RepID=UPI0025C2105B|nr:undecaprenyl-diphosphate phosphatase [Glycocaulis sp.]MCH8521827.1 undecaprenyl-diphosphate phosphatase [Glycocaulis sp.]
MTLTLLILIAIVQGLTEFLPVSSSAHLILAPLAFGVEPQSVLIDVMAHIGSLLAVFVYFRKEIWQVITGVLAWFSGKLTPGGRLALLVLIATPPVMIAGAVLYFTGLMDHVRSPAVIAGATLVFALPLWLADRYGPRVKTVDTLTYKDAAVIGLAQAVAMIPGSSRSGLMMTAARMLGAERSAAARFAMLSSIPVIAAFGLQSGIDLARGEDPGASLMDGLLAVGLSFAASLLAIHLLLKLVDRFGFLPFVIYRIALALAIIAVLVWVV